MNKVTSFVVSLISAIVMLVVVVYSKTARLYGVDATTFVLYWAFLYLVFHDKDKDQ